MNLLPLVQMSYVCLCDDETDALFMHQLMLRCVFCHAMRLHVSDRHAQALPLVKEIALCALENT